MSDDWRIRIELPEEAHAGSFLGRLGFDLGSDEARQLAKELEGRRLAVSQDDNELFVYASSQAEAEQARAIVQAELADEGMQGSVSQPERWLHEEERWSDEPPRRPGKRRRSNAARHRGKYVSSASPTRPRRSSPTSWRPRATSRCGGGNT